MGWIPRWLSFHPWNWNKRMCKRAIEARKNKRCKTTNTLHDGEKKREWHYKWKWWDEQKHVNKWTSDVFSSLPLLISVRSLIFLRFVRTSQQFTCSFKYLYLLLNLFAYFHLEDSVAVVVVTAVVVTVVFAIVGC